MKRLLVVLALSAVPVWSQVEHEVSVVPTVNLTTASLGAFKTATESGSIWQTNDRSYGLKVSFERWSGANGFVVSEGYTRTDAVLEDLSRVRTDEWILERYETDFLFERRFFAGHRFEPYIGSGVFAAVLWGGSAPAHTNTNTSGLDGLWGFATPAGVRARLSSRLSLSAGVLVDSGRASTYGDQTYTSSQNLVIQPGVGVSFRVGGGKNR